MLEQYVKNRLAHKDILLMTHIVIGYPSFEDSFRIVAAMVEGGVDIMELQIPFSEPIADGPVILAANQSSLAHGATVQKCFEFVQKVTRTFDIPFLFMSYYNILFKYGLNRFIDTMAAYDLKGAIVPDLPPEEGQDYFKAMQAHSLAPILLFSPTTRDSRMKYIDSFAGGFIYCVARKGVTGLNTSFSEHLQAYLQRCRRATDLPLALGFGVKSQTDIDFLKGQVDIAVIGTQTIRLMDQEGIRGVGDFIKNLKS